MSSRRPDRGALPWPGLLAAVATLVLAQEMFLDAFLAIAPGLSRYGFAIYFAGQLGLQIIIGLAFAYLLQFVAEKMMKALR